MPSLDTVRGAKVHGSPSVCHLLLLLEEYPNIFCSGSVGHSLPGRNFQGRLLLQAPPSGM